MGRGGSNGAAGEVLPSPSNIYRVRAGVIAGNATADRKKGKKKKRARDPDQDGDDGRADRGQVGGGGGLDGSRVFDQRITTRARGSAVPLAVPSHAQNGDLGQEGHGRGGGGLH